jgi:two-component system sensor histidine kinase QseC
MGDRMKIRSIKTYLMATLLSGILLSGIITAIWSFWHTRHEVGEVLDAHIAQTARLYHGVLLDHMDRDSLQDIQSVFDDAVLNQQWQQSWEASENPYEYALVFQAWSNDGRTLIFNDESVLETRPVKAGYQNVRFDGEEWRVFVVIDERHNITLLTAQNQDVRAEIVGGIAFKVLVPMLIMIPLLLLGGGWVLTRGFKPLALISSNVKQRTADDLSPLRLAYAPDEVADLVWALNQMFDRLASAWERERRFTDDAAHELRTPIAALALQLESSGIDSKHYPSVFKAVSRLERLVSQLLVLARSSDIPLDEKQVWIQEALETDSTTVLAELVPLADQHGVDLFLNIEADDEIPLNLTSDAYAIVLRNVVENAIRYTREHDQIAIDIRLSSKALTLKVIDHGVGLNDDLKSKVLERFYRGDKADSQGAGLGLPIVISIVQYSGASFHLLDTPGGGVTAEITWRLSDIP